MAGRDGMQSTEDQSGTLRAGEAIAPYPTAAEAFLQLLTSEVNRNDVHKMVGSQEHMLMRFEKTNEMLLNFNSLSTARYESTCHDFRHHTQLLLEMKKDLDSVFKRIRAIKTKLSQQHPEAFKVCGDVYTMLEVEEMQEVGDNPDAASHPTAEVSHPTAAAEIHPGAAVTHLGAVETPSTPHLVESSKNEGSNAPDTETRASESVRPKEPKSSRPQKKDRKTEFRKSWPAAKTPTGGRTQPGVAVVVEGEDDDSD